MHTPPLSRLSLLPTVFLIRPGRWYDQATVGTLLQHGVGLSDEGHSFWTLLKHEITSGDGRFGPLTLLLMLQMPKAHEDSKKIMQTSNYILSYIVPIACLLLTVCFYSVASLSWFASCC